MSKIKTSLFLLVTLFTACSSQESNSTTETNTSIVKENSEKIIEEKNVSKNKVETNSMKKTQTIKEQKSLFTLTTLDGKRIHINETEGGLSFEEYKDKVVLVLFFGHKCPPCLREIPVLKALTEKKHKDLEIIAIEVQGYGNEQLKAFKEAKGINYTLVTYNDSLNFINYIGQQTQWSGAIPFLVGFDKNTVVKIVHAGGLSAKDFDNIYNSLAKGE
jgi:thiol-disulfide isomerase/thioredoxin